MKRNDKQRLFEVMSRLDKTFKPTLNEGFEELEATDDVALPAETGEEAPETSEEKSPEEKLAELTAKVDELYALLHGETEGKPEEIGIETGEVDAENLQEWNFDKKKGEKKDDEEKEGDDEKEEKKELDEAKPKIPVAAIAKVSKK